MVVSLDVVLFFKENKDSAFKFCHQGLQATQMVTCTRKQGMSHAVVYQNSERNTHSFYGYLSVFSKSFIGLTTAYNMKKLKTVRTLGIVSNMHEYTWLPAGCN